MVRRRARRLLGDDEAARDVMHDVFVTVQARGQALEDSGLSSWLYVVTTNLCLKRMRAAATRRRLAGAVAQVEETAPRGEAAVAVRDALAGLPAQVALAAVYRFADEMTHAEIADALGCSRRHVGELLRRFDRAMAPWRRAAVLALAALGLLRPDAGQPDPRAALAKGGAAATLIVEHAGVQRAVGAVGRVAAGDRLQLTVRVPAPRFVAVYSRDGAGAITRYAPIATAMQAIAPGREQLLPNSTILDEVPGHETIAVFACVAAQADAVLRAHVLIGAPPGCEVLRSELIKP